MDSNDDGLSHYMQKSEYEGMSNFGGADNTKSGNMTGKRQSQYRPDKNNFTS